MSAALSIQYQSRADALAHRGSLLTPLMATHLATAPIKLCNERDCEAVLLLDYADHDVENFLHDAISAAKLIRARGM